MTNKNLDRAMVMAAEYRREAGRLGANDARCRELRNDIDTLIGRFVDGKLTLPDLVREEMGLVARTAR